MNGRVHWVQMLRPYDSSAYTYETPEHLTGPGLHRLLLYLEPVLNLTGYTSYGGVLNRRFNSRL